MRHGRGGAPVGAVLGRDAGGQEPPLQMQGDRVLVTPADEAPAHRLLASCGYTRAARDARHFAALSGRFTQNLCRYVGYDVRYFAAALSRPRHCDHLRGSPGWPAAATPAFCTKVRQPL
jgi:hypothetical protein